MFSCSNSVTIKCQSTHYSKVMRLTAWKSACLIWGLNGVKLQCVCNLSVYKLRLFRWTICLIAVRTSRTKQLLPSGNLCNHITIESGHPEVAQISGWCLSTQLLETFLRPQKSYCNHWETTDFFHVAVLFLLWCDRATGFSFISEIHGDRRIPDDHA